MVSGSNALDFRLFIMVKIKKPRASISSADSWSLAIIKEYPRNGFKPSKLANNLLIKI